MSNLATLQGALQFAEQQRADMARCWQRHRRFEVAGMSYGGYVFGTHNIRVPQNMLAVDQWATGEKLDRPVPIKVEFGPTLQAIVRGYMKGRDEFDQATAMKDVLSTGIKAFAALSKACGVLFMAEAWVAESPLEQSGKATWSSEDSYEAWRKTIPRSLEDYDKRKEELWMILEHTELPERRMWRAPITRDPDRLHPWYQAELGAAAEGRFVQFLGDRVRS